MIDRFQALTRREQILIACAALFLPAALIWQTLWAPLEAARRAQTAEIARLDALIHVAGQAGQAPLPAARFDTPPAQRITRSAARAGIALTRLEPEANLYRVTVGEVQFDTAITWIANLQTEHGLTAREVDMARRTAPGAVTLHIALEDPP